MTATSLFVGFVGIAVGAAAFFCVGVLVLGLIGRWRGN